MVVTPNGQCRRTSNPVIARKIWMSIGELLRDKQDPAIDLIVNDLERYEI